MILDLADRLGHAKMFSAVRYALGLPEKTISSFDADEIRAWTLALFGHGACEQALTCLSGQPANSQSDDLRLLYALLLRRNGEDEHAINVLDSISDTNARSFAREILDFGAGKGQEAPQAKPDDGDDHFWQADLPSSVKMNFMGMASTEIAWAWHSRGKDDKAFEALKDVKFEEIGSRSAALLSCLLAAKGENGARIAQLIYLESCGGSDDEFMRHGPLFSNEERKAVDNFLAGQKRLLIPVDQTSDNH